MARRIRTIARTGRPTGFNWLITAIKPREALVTSKAGGNCGFQVKESASKNVLASSQLSKDGLICFGQHSQPDTDSLAFRAQKGIGRPLIAQ